MLTDNQGRTVDFKNTVIIMTSNIGSLDLIDGLQEDGTISERAQNSVMGQLRNSFKPEFLNRIDEIVLFKPLQRSEIFKIIDLQIADLRKRLNELEIEIILEDSAKDLILEEAYSVQYGARPVKRFIQREIETKLSRMLIAEEIMPGSTAVIKSKGDELKIEVV